MPKDELAGRKASLAEHRALARTQDRRKSLCPLEEGTGNSGALQAYCEVMQGES